MEDLREEWLEQDKNRYVLREEFGDPGKIDEVDKKANSIYDILLKHEALTNNQNKELN